MGDAEAAEKAAMEAEGNSAVIRATAAACKAALEAIRKAAVVGAADAA